MNLDWGVLGCAISKATKSWVASLPRPLLSEHILVGFEIPRLAAAMGSSRVGGWYSDCGVNNGAPIHYAERCWQVLIMLFLQAYWTWSESRLLLTRRWGMGFGVVQSSEHGLKCACWLRRKVAHQIVEHPRLTVAQCILESCSTRSTGNVGQLR